LEANARLQVAQKESQAQIIEAEAESQMAPNLENKRAFKEKLMLNEALKKMARTQKIVIAGESGEEFLKIFHDIAIDVSKK
jgi:hypothetical protein